MHTYPANTYNVINSAATQTTFPTFTTTLHFDNGVVPPVQNPAVPHTTGHDFKLHCSM